LVLLRSVVVYEHTSDKEVVGVFVRFSITLWLMMVQCHQQSVFLVLNNTPSRYAGKSGAMSHKVSAVWRSYCAQTGAYCALNILRVYQAVSPGITQYFASSGTSALLTKIAAAARACGLYSGGGDPLAPARLQTHPALSLCSCTSTDALNAFRLCSHTESLITFRHLAQRLYLSSYSTIRLSFRFSVTLALSLLPRVI
jgi:hypothetical protein